MYLWRVADEEQREAGATTSERHTGVCRSPLGDERRGDKANPVTPTKLNKSSEMATFSFIFNNLS